MKYFDFRVPDYATPQEWDCFPGISLRTGSVTANGCYRGHLAEIIALAHRRCFLDKYVSDANAYDSEHIVRVLRIDTMTYLAEFGHGPVLFCFSISEPVLGESMSQFGADFVSALNLAELYGEPKPEVRPVMPAKEAAAVPEVLNGSAS